MVSPKLAAEIKRGFEALQNQKLEIHDYGPPLLDVVFEIYTADTFVAGSLSISLLAMPATKVSAV